MGAPGGGGKLVISTKTEGEERECGGGNGPGGPLRGGGGGVGKRRKEKWAPGLREGKRGKKGAPAGGRWPSFLGSCLGAPGWEEGGGGWGPRGEKGGVKRKKWMGGSFLGGGGGPGERGKKGEKKGEIGEGWGVGGARVQKSGG